MFWAFKKNSWRHFHKIVDPWIEKVYTFCTYVSPAVGFENNYSVVKCFTNNRNYSWIIIKIIMAINFRNDIALWEFCILTPSRWQYFFPQYPRVNSKVSVTNRQMLPVSNLGKNVPVDGKCARVNFWFDAYVHRKLSGRYQWNVCNFFPTPLF